MLREKCATHGGVGGGPALLLAAALLAGCMQTPTTSLQRAASFQPLASRRVGPESLSDFVCRRTALLIGGMPAGGASELPLDSLAHAMKAVHEHYAMGSATAIDHRGYFLTAAHCVDRRPLHIVCVDVGGRVRLTPARVVWRGNPKKEGDDLAVLAIDEPVNAFFDWADGIAIGDPVVGVGPDYDDAEDFRLGCFSGAALKQEKQSDTMPPGETIFHSGPVHLGDSGGPLVTTSGRLIGINVGDVHEYDLLRWSHQTAARAHRPDRAWLKTLIDRDFILRQTRTAARR